MGVLSVSASSLIGEKYNSVVDVFNEVFFINVELLVVAGGGSGGSSAGGGGGAGSLIEGTTNVLFSTYPITIGAGGAATPTNGNGNAGNSSIFSTVTANGGGRGSTYGQAGGSGGSGGGGGSNTSGLSRSASVIGTVPNGLIGYGNSGGIGASGATNSRAGSGGGAGGEGLNGTAGLGPGMAGGIGRSSSISGSAVTYATGGNGGWTQTGQSNQPNATINTGNGGNGSADNTTAGSGGSGVVILKYPDTVTARFSAGVTQTTSTSGGFKVSTITATSTTSETVTFNSASLFSPLWYVDFQVETTSGWSPSTYDSCNNGAPSVTNNVTHWFLDSGRGGVSLCYSNAVISRTVGIVSAERVSVYVDAEVLVATTNRKAQINIQNVASRLDIPVASRKAIKIGTSAAPISLTQVLLETPSLWGDSGARITEGEMNVYGIYMCLLSEESLMEEYLQNKGLVIY